uniref:GABA(C) receptor n=1 Tax=Monodelphis domestica TaxID=13616 RepID=F6YJ09_MONDO
MNVSPTFSWVIFSSSICSLLAILFPTITLYIPSTCLHGHLTIRYLRKRLKYFSCFLFFYSKREIKMKKKDSTKVWPLKHVQLLHIEDHDFAMRPGFGGAPVPVGIDVQIESIDSISEVDKDFTMTFYLRHYWKDERLSFPSRRNKSMTFDSRLIQKIWVPDVFFVHSKRSFIHDTTVENMMLRVYPDGNVLFSLRITVSAMCFMDFSRFPLDTQNCSLELESYAYNEEDLMLYWKHGNKSLITDEHISLSQFFVEEFSASSGLAFYSSTGIHFKYLRMFFPQFSSYQDRHQPSFFNQSMWLKHKALPRSCITTVLTMSTIMTGASASMPQVSYIKAVDIYLWVSFLFVFLSVIEYAALNYLTTVEEGKQLKKRGKLCGLSMAFDGCYHDSETDIDLAPFSLHSEEYSVNSQNPSISNTDSAQLKRKKSLRGHVGKIILKNNHIIDTYSRIVFPAVFIVFNFFYWGFYV